MRAGATDLLHFAARTYAQHYKWAVFPCRGKLPATAHGFRDASMDAQQIAGWWRREPYNIGVCPPPGVFVLDIDPRNGGDETLAELEAKHGALPITPEVKTGGGGVHFYFASTVPVRSCSPAPGIDVKHGGAGYVLAPPSVHPDTGREYRWTRAPKVTPFASAPEWLVEMIRERPRAASVSRPAPVEADAAVFERARKYVKCIDGAVSGQDGQRQTFYVARVLVRGFALSRADALWIMTHDYNMRCVPPWSQPELERKVEQAENAAEPAYGALRDRKAA